MATIKLRDPVHNFIRFDEEEVKLINLDILQRLRGIRQLALAALVYPGALHTRFDHTLGVAHVAGQMADGLGLDNSERSLVRLAALLHDVGHGPFSHVSEYALDRYADRGHLPKDLKKEKVHEIITGHLICNHETLINRLGRERCEQIARLLSTGVGDPVLKSIVSGPLDSDKQDYLLRDSVFTGVNYGIFDIHQLQRSLVCRPIGGQREMLIRPDGVHAVEQFVMAKYYLTTMVYRHKVRLITDQMIVRAIELGIEKDRESSRNDEASILVEKPGLPGKFEDESVLFSSINERLSDEFVEVYAPVSWPNIAERSRHLNSGFAPREPFAAKSGYSSPSCLSCSGGWPGFRIGILRARRRRKKTTAWALSVPSRI
jgi:HD superfamily phosphohydrolase